MRVNRLISPFGHMPFILRQQRESISVGTIVAWALGVVIAVFGFAAMRDPMRLNLNPFSPGWRGYYQRMVLDTPTRNQLRLFGAMISLLGSGFFTASLSSALKSHWLDAVSRGLVALMTCIFLGSFSFSVILSAWRLFTGQTVGWFKMWMQGAQLGPIDIFPAITPKMQREARIYTVAFLTLASVAALASVWVSWR